MSNIRRRLREIRKTISFDEKKNKKIVHCILYDIENENKHNVYCAIGQTIQPNLRLGAENYTEYNRHLVDVWHKNRQNIVKAFTGIPKPAVWCWNEF